MKKVDLPQVIISTATIFGIGLLLLNLSVKVVDTVCDLLYATVYDTDAEEYDTDAEETN